MPEVQRSHRVLYIDTSPDSQRAVELLNGLTVEFAKVFIGAPDEDLRPFPRLPALTYVTRSGCVVTRAGLDQIEAVIEGVRSDYLTEIKERQGELAGQRSEWDPDQIAQMKRLAELGHP